MGNDVNTNVIVTAQAKGFAEAQNQASRLTRESTKGAKAQAKATKEAVREMGNLEKQLQGLTSEQTKLTKAMVEIEDKASPAYKKLAQNLRAVRTEGGSVSSMLGQMGKAFRVQQREQEQFANAQEKKRRASASQGGFMQGALQGGSPGTAAFIQRGPGMGRQVAGLAAGRAARGIGGAMTGGGIGAIATALSGIPGGELLTAPLMAGAQRAGQALQFRQQQQQARPFLGGALSRGGAQGRLQGSAAQLGMDAPEALQFQQQVSTVGGGTGEGTQGRFGRSALAAQRAYGVGAETSGAFLQAGRRGGLVGAEGRPGRGLVEALREGMAMGLEGSELTDFMQQMANDISSWKQTGIPINARSVGALGQELGRLGLGGVRGGVVGRGITQAAQRLSQRGPQTAGEAMILQELGGFQGGGAEAFEEAQLRLEEGNFGSEQLQGLLGRFMQAGGGGAVGRQAFRGAMGKMGINVGVSETRLLEKQLRGEDLSPEDRKRIAGIDKRQRAGRKKAPTSQGELFSQAAAISDSSLRRQAEITNEQISTGANYIKATLDLEEATSKIAESFNTLAGPSLGAATEAINNFAVAANAASGANPHVAKSVALGTLNPFAGFAHYFLAGPD